MTPELCEKLIQLPFWQDYTFWISIANIFILGITLYWLKKYTQATQKMVNNQITPAINVNMNYDENAKKTYFWFSNASNIPAFVSIEVKVKMNGVIKTKKDIGPYRISPYHPDYKELKKTATSFDFLKDGNEVSLIIAISPAIDDNNKIKTKFNKSYKFNEGDKRWDENTWNFPDLPFPQS